jgi:hypothetical protein
MYKNMMYIFVCRSLNCFETLPSGLGKQFSFLKLQPPNIYIKHSTGTGNRQRGGRRDGIVSALYKSLSTKCTIFSSLKKPPDRWRKWVSGSSNPGYLGHKNKLLQQFSLIRVNFTYKSVGEKPPTVTKGP